MQKIISIKIILCIVVWISITKLNAQQPVTWDYPIKPGSPEFKSAPTLSGSLALLNIPDDRIKQMDTYHLVKTCLNYPQFFWALTQNSLQEGYDFIKRNFNGFREMEIRKDAVYYLLEEYKKRDPRGFNPNGSNLEIGGHVLSFLNIELMLAQNGVISNCNTDLKHSIIQEALIKFDQKSPIRYYRIIGLSTTAYILARYLESEKALFTGNEEVRPMISEFLTSCRYINNELLNAIADQARNYLSER